MCLTSVGPAPTETRLQLERRAVCEGVRWWQRYPVGTLTVVTTIFPNAPWYLSQKNIAALHRKRRRERNSVQPRQRRTRGERVERVDWKGK